MEGCTKETGCTKKQDAQKKQGTQKKQDFLSMERPPTTLQPLSAVPSPLDPFFNSASSGRGLFQPGLRTSSRAAGVLFLLERLDFFLLLFFLLLLPWRVAPVSNLPWFGTSEGTRHGLHAQEGSTILTLFCPNLEPNFYYGRCLFLTLFTSNSYRNITFYTSLDSS